MTRALLLAAALLVTGCREGNTLGNVGTQSTLVDLGQSHASPDLAESSSSNGDMAASATCGSIVTCGISCIAGSASSTGDAGLGGLGGLGGLAGCASCLQGAPADATMEAEALIACAVQSCLSSISGGISISLLECLGTSCSSEIAACQGLGLGGLGGL